MYNVVLLLLDWAASHPDLMSEHHPDDQAFLRASSDGGGSSALHRSRGRVIDATAVTEPKKKGKEKYEKSKNAHNLIFTTCREEGRPI
jgi:hypothetical protein